MTCHISFGNFFLKMGLLHLRKNSIRFMKCVFFTQQPWLFFTGNLFYPALKDGVPADISACAS